MLIVGAPWDTMTLLVMAGGKARLALSPIDGATVRVAGIVPSRAALQDMDDKLGFSLRTAATPSIRAAYGRTEPAAFATAVAPVEQDLFASTRLAARAGAKVVLWSENAVPVGAAGVPALLTRASQIARQEWIHLDVAVNVPFLRDETHLFGPDGRALWTYAKAHPIPGMEIYAPGRARVPVVGTPHGRLANVICYDADFPALFAGTRADIMLLPGGDWPSMGSVHTLKMARLRAIENGFSLVRQDFDGVSAALDAHGRVLAQKDMTVASPGIFIADVPFGGERTIYGVIGDAFAQLCCALVIIAIASGLARRGT